MSRISLGRRTGSRGVESRRAQHGVILALLLGVVLPAAADEPVPVPPPENLAGSVDALVKPLQEARVFSGVILVAREDQVLLVRAAGFANWEVGAPNDRSTRFGIASISKPMTEALVRLLVKEERLRLDDPVEKYLPGFPRGPGGRIPTVEDVLTHRAGVPHRLTTNAEEMQVLRPADIVARVRSAGLLFEPGAKTQYSSAGYTALARIIEIVEKQPFDDVLAARVFRPAGMSSATSETGEGLMPRRAMPYRLGSDRGKLAAKNAPHKDLRFLTGAGSVYATVDDLLAFVQAVRRGAFGPELKEEIAGGDADEWRNWTGRTNGYEAYLDVLPRHNVIVILLSNLQSAANWQLQARIKGLVTGTAASPIPLPPAVAPAFEEAEALVGTYGSAEITLRDGKLFRGDNELYPITGRRYYVPGSGAIVRFRRDDAGRVDALIASPDGVTETVLPRTSP